MPYYMQNMTNNMQNMLFYMQYIPEIYAQYDMKHAEYAEYDKKYTQYCQKYVTQYAKYD